MMVRWRLETLDGLTSYTFEMSPSQMDSPLLEQSIDSHATGIDGVVRGFRKDKPRDWSFSGTLRTKAQYDAFVAWLDRGKVHLTDHLERTFLVRLTKFEPTRAGTRQAPWRHHYTMSVTTYGGPL